MTDTNPQSYVTQDQLRELAQAVAKAKAEQALVDAEYIERTTRIQAQIENANDVFLAYAATQPFDGVKQQIEIGSLVLKKRKLPDELTFSRSPEHTLNKVMKDPALAHLLDVRLDLTKVKNADPDTQKAIGVKMKPQGDKLSAEVKELKLPKLKS